MRFVPYSFSYTHVEYYTEGIAIFWQMAFTLGLKGQGWKSHGIL